MPDHYLFLTAEVTPVSANSFIQFLGSLIHASPDHLIIAMNSPGGNVISGIAMHSAMMAMPYPIVTHNIGNVDSIAVVVYLGGNERRACAASTFMFHGVGFNGNANERLEENNLKAKLDTVLSDHRRISGIFSARTNGTVSVRAGMRLFKEQRTRNADWARDNGFVTGIQDFTLPVGANVNYLA